MLVVDEYEFFRTPENNLLLAVVGPFEREDDRESFLEGLYENGFWIRRKDGDKVHLEAVLANLGLSIGGQDTLVIEIDNSLNEEELL